MRLLAPYFVTFLVQTSFGYELRKVPLPSPKRNLKTFKQNGYAQAGCLAQKSAYNNSEI